MYDAKVGFFFRVHSQYMADDLNDKIRKARQRMKQLQREGITETTTEGIYRAIEHCQLRAYLNEVTLIAIQKDRTK